MFKGIQLLEKYNEYQMDNMNGLKNVIRMKILLRLYLMRTLLNLFKNSV